MALLAIGNAGELARFVVEVALGHRAGGPVEAPFMQPRTRFGVGCFAHFHRRGIAPDLGHPHAVDHGFVAFVDGVERMEAIARLHVEPLHIGIGAFPRHDTKAGRVIVAPADRHAALHGQLEIEDGGQIHEDRVITGGRHIVHHGGPRHGDGRALHHFSALRDPVISQVGLDLGVTEAQHFARVGTEFRVRGKGAGENTVKGMGPHRGEIRRDLVGEGALLQGENPSAVTHDMSIGGRNRVIEGEGFLVERQFQAIHARMVILRRTHITIAIPGGLAVLEFDPVQHAVADEPVFGPTRLGVGGIADVATVEFGGN